MAPQELLLHVFCLVDDERHALGGPPPRPGPRPRLADGEEIAIEPVGELRGLADGVAIYRHSRHHYPADFPPWRPSTAPVSPARPPPFTGGPDACNAGSSRRWPPPGRSG